MANDRQPAPDGAALEGAAAWDSPLRDFFISFTQADREWADWIAWALAEAGYDLFYQHWDFLPGSNFMVEMQRALLHARQTILVLSDAAIRSDFVRLEWTTAMSADPTGAKRKLVPVRVRPLTVPLGMLGQIVYVDLVDLGWSDARDALLGAFRQRSRRATRRAVPQPPPFPGTTAELDLGERLREQKQKIEQALVAEQATAAVERSALGASLAGVGVRHFNILLEVLDVPRGVVPPMPAEQPERIRALLDWEDGERTGLARLESLTEVLHETCTGRVPLDQLAPDRLALDAIDSCDRELREIDQLGRAYIAVELWPKAYLTYRTLVDLAAEEDTLRYAGGLARLGQVHWRYGEEGNAENSWKLSRAVYRFLARDDRERRRALQEAEQMRQLEEETRAIPPGRPAPGPG